MAETKAEGDFWEARGDPLGFFYECVRLGQDALLERMRKDQHFKVQLEGYDCPHLAAKIVLWSVWEKLGQEVTGGARYAWNGYQLQKSEPVA